MNYKLSIQNIINNFISTLVIMVERPVKIGNIVDIQGVVGKVSSIGGRSITITRFDGSKTLIPNGKLIQSNLTNWSVKGKKIKYHININVIKSDATKLHHSQIVKQLEKTISGLTKFITSKEEYEVHLTKIEKDYDQFCIKLSCDEKIIKNPTSLKNTINFSLLKNLSDKFTVEYSINFF